jgi:hypothetical protein
VRLTWTSGGITTVFWTTGFSATGALVAGSLVIVGSFCRSLIVERTILVAGEVIRLAAFSKLSLQSSMVDSLYFRSKDSVLSEH